MDDFVDFTDSNAFPCSENLPVAFKLITALYRYILGTNVHGILKTKLHHCYVIWSTSDTVFSIFEINTNIQSQLLFLDFVYLVYFIK